MVDEFLWMGFFYSFVNKYYCLWSFRLKADVWAFLPYKSPHYLLNADLYNAARYLSLISILLAANSERMWHLKLFLFPGGGTWKIHIKEAWEQAHWDSITSLNIDISLKLTDSLNNFFLPHFSRYIDKWQNKSESWVSAASLLFFLIYVYIFSCFKLTTTKDLCHILCPSMVAFMCKASPKPSC